MVSRLELLAVPPLNVVHDMAAVFAAVQADRYEAGLARHEAGALFHQLQHLGLVVGRNLHGGDLGHHAVVFTNLGHVRSPVVPGDNAHFAAQVSTDMRGRAQQDEDQSGTDGCQLGGDGGFQPADCASSARSSIARAIATVRRAISACSRSTMRPSSWTTPLSLFSGRLKAAMIFLACATSSLLGEKAALHGPIWFG